MAFPHAKQILLRLLRRGGCFDSHSPTERARPTTTIEEQTTTTTESELSAEFLTTFPPKQNTDQGLIRAFRLIACNETECRQQARRRLSCSDEPVFLPEHQLTVNCRRPLDLAIPKEIQESQISSDLHVLSSSDEAGILPYCEDVANRNLHRSSARPISTLPQADLSSRARDVLSPSHEISQYISSYTRRGARRHSVHVDRPATRFGNGPHEQQQAIGGQTNSVYLPPLRRDGRRQSLSRKANVIDLRVASESEHPTETRRQSQRCGSNQRVSTASAKTRPCLDKPLPPTPSEWMAGWVHDRTQTSEAPSQHSNIRRWSAPHMTENTTFSEQWLPAVTHHTIKRDIHSIREEQTRKEIHQNHIYRRIQPIFEYEILPTRHFVHVEGGSYTEVGEADLPEGVAKNEWFAEGLASRLRDSEGSMLGSGTGDGEVVRCELPNDAQTQGDFSYTENTLVETPIYETAHWSVHPIERPVFACGKVWDTFDFKAQHGQLHEGVPA